MMQLFKYWDHVRSSFWFIPSILVIVAVGLAFGAVALDEVVAEKHLWFQEWIYTGSAEGASMILGTVAGSMITIAGVVFSITLVALTLASSQFGPHLLRNFRRDTANQFVIGVFVATFLYCLLVLRSIRREDVGSFVPDLSVTLAVLFALMSVGVLIFYIHHIAVTIQAGEMAARVACEAFQLIDRLFPEHIGKGPPSQNSVSSNHFLPEKFEPESCPISAVKDGYLQLIDPDILMKLAVSAEVVVRVERRPGHYVIAGSPLVRVWPGERVTKKLRDKINSAFVLGNHRTPNQDIAFSVHQLVEIAVRALSSGINDPFTAITCMDWIGSILCRLVQRELPSPYRRDDQNRLRVVAPATTLPAIIDTAFNQIRQCARTDAAVSIRLLEIITETAQVARRSEDRAALWRQAQMIAQGASEALPEEEDRRAVEECYQTARQVLADME